MIALIAFAAITQSSGWECPISLRFAEEQPALARLAQRYADCVTRPQIPFGNELAGALQRCAEVRSRLIGRAEHVVRTRRGSISYRDQIAAARSPYEWVDHVATTLAGCETNIFVGDAGRLGN